MDCASPSLCFPFYWFFLFMVFFKLLKIFSRVYTAVNVRCHISYHFALLVCCLQQTVPIQSNLLLRVSFATLCGITQILSVFGNLVVCPPVRSAHCNPMQMIYIQTCTYIGDSLVQHNCVNYRMGAG